VRGGADGGWRRNEKEKGAVVAKTWPSDASRWTVGGASVTSTRIVRPLPSIAVFLLSPIQPRAVTNYACVLAVGAQPWQRLGEQITSQQQGLSREKLLHSTRQSAGALRRLSTIFLNYVIYHLIINRLIVLFIFFIMHVY
jgi:hypothetical protein